MIRSPPGFSLHRLARVLVGARKYRANSWYMLFAFCLRLNTLGRGGEGRGSTLGTAVLGRLLPFPLIGWDAPTTASLECCKAWGDRISEWLEVLRANTEVVTKLMRPAGWRARPI